MAKVVIESKGAAAVTFEVPEGGALVDLCDVKRTPVPFSCRSASCGTCRIEILEGAAELLPPEDEELDILDVFGDSPKTRRLACQAQLRAGTGVVRIRPVASDL